MQRNTLVLTLALAALALGTTASAQRDPRARFDQNKPAPQHTAAAPEEVKLIADQGVTGPLHAAHQRQIVFTRRDLTMGAITQADLASDFTLGEPMYFRVYTAQSAVNAIASANGLPASKVYADGVHYTARFTIDGQVFDTVIFPWGGRRDHESWTTWRGQFVNPGNAQRTPGTDAFLEMLSRATAAGLLKPGRHSIKMELIPATNTENSGPIKAGTVATGTFNLTVPAGIFQSRNPAVCGPGRGGAGSTALEVRALSEAKRISRSADLVPVRAIGIGESWDVRRNDITGIPTERWTYVAIQSRGAKYCTSNTHQFFEDYMGGGNFSTSTGSISVNFTPGYVPCGCLG